MRKLILLIAAIIPTFLTGCLSTKSQSTFTPGGGGTVSISVSPSTTQTVEVSQSLNLAATVVNTNGSNITVNWTVTGAGCSGNACGTITASSQASATAPPATYTAPNLLPTPPTVTIVATAAADTTKTVSVVVNLVSNVTVSPNLAAVQVQQQKNFTATVVGPPAGQTGVTWSLSGPACSGATCGALSNVTATSVTYTAPATAPSTPAATLTATAQFDSSSNTATITIGPSPADNRLSGRYAFSYRGYPNPAAGGTPTVEAGSLVFDGNGNVSGIEDDNDGTTVHTQVVVTGSYTVQEADGRGIITLNNANLITTLQIVVLSTADGTVAQTAYITDFGGTVAGSGKMELQQNPSTLTLAQLTGGYAVSLRGGTVPSAVGRFDLNGAGVINTTAEIGSSLTDATCPTTPALDTTYTRFGGTYGPIDTTTGRTSFNFTGAQIGATKNLALTFAGYIVSPTEVLFVETDTTGFTFLGRAEQQSPNPPNFVNGSFSGQYSYLMQSNNGRGTGNVSLGPAVSDGAGTIADFEFFGNADGVVATPATGFQESSGAYALQSSGAGTGIFCGGTMAGQVPTSNFALYMVSSSKMFVWNADRDTLGEIDFQAGGPFASLSGTYAFQLEGVQGTFTGAHAATNAIAESGVVIFTPTGSGTGTAAFTIDEANVSSPPTTKTLNATYVISTGSNDPDGDGDPGGDIPGWGTLSFTNPPFPVPDRFVVVSANKIFFTRNATDSNIAGVAETQ